MWCNYNCCAATADVAVAGVCAGSKCKIWCAVVLAPRSEVVLVLVLGCLFSEQKLAFGMLTYPTTSHSTSSTRPDCSRKWLLLHSIALDLDVHVALAVYK